MLEQLIKEYEDTKKEFKLKIQSEFENLVKNLRDEIPEGVSFGWTQYTMAFNDGDPCYFSVYADEMKINVGDEEFEGTYEFEGEEGKVEGTEVTYKQLDHLHDAISKLVYGMPEEFLEDAYGDGVTVTISKDKIDVEEYDCGY